MSTDHSWFPRGIESTLDSSFFTSASMKKIYASLATGMLLCTPLTAFAHETQEFKIGDHSYSFVVGSLNEPMIVDDKSGVDLTVTRLDAAADPKAMMHDDGDGDAAAGAPVSGLETNLKVEVSAGDRKKVMDLSPQWGVPGGYKAVFFPTVQTTLNYRFFGTVDAVPVDLTFSCNPAGHPATPENTTETTLSGQVTRTLKKGAFGCPLAKADLGFPEPSAMINDLKPKEAASTHDPLAIAALAIAALGLVIGLSARMRRVQ